MGYLLTKQEIARVRARQWYATHPERGKANARRSALANPDKRRASARRHQLKQYGLTEPDYVALHTAQKGKCAICGRTAEEAERKPRVLVVDHCHVTNVVRALLCVNCNHGLGSFKDRAELCRRAADYLTKYEKG